MFPQRPNRRCLFLCFLRASGGVSAVLHLFITDYKFSPRKRRCFYGKRNRNYKRRVFSAQAEVFPTPFSLSVAGERFLRASGGVSIRDSRRSVSKRFSPRKRRCFQRGHFECRLSFVFSAQAEVFPAIHYVTMQLLRFLRASGGVSCF